MMAEQVYKLKLSDLPLDRLSEQKSKRQRGMQRKSWLFVAGRHYIIYAKF